MMNSDLREVDKYVGVLSRQKKQLLQAQSRKGQRPRYMPPVDQLAFSFEMQTIMNDQALAGHPDMYQVRTSFVPEAYPPCVKPLSKLDKIMINELRLETHHRGRYLLVHSVTQESKLNGVTTIVEDEDADGVMVQIYNQYDEPIDEIVGKWTTFVIMEPYFKQTSSGSYAVRVDHVSDFHCLLEDDMLVPKCWRVETHASAIEWKSRGNYCFEKQKFNSAIDW